MTSAPGRAEKDPVAGTTRRTFLGQAAIAAGGGALAACAGADPLTLTGEADAGAVALLDSEAAPDALVFEDAVAFDDAAAEDARAFDDAGEPDAQALDAGEADAGTADAGVTEDPTQLTEASAFRLGVASGDVRADSALLWTRYDGLLPLRLAVWRMDGERYAEQIAEVPAMVEDGGFIHAEVAGLLPSTRYRYAFFETVAGVRTSRSPIGRFRTAPGAMSMEPLLVGACSCTKNGSSFGTIERAGEREDLDVFLLLGDTTYNDSANSLPEYRAKWEENLATPGYKALRARTSVVATWDDHEVDNDWNPESYDPQHLDRARRAFFENLPVRPEAPGRVWRTVSWGRTMEIFVLDCRAERKPSTRRDAGAEYLSRAQMDWLKVSLSTSTAVFKLIMNSVPITTFPGFFDLSANDRWEGYAAARTEILTHIDSAPITGVIWLAGDFHMASVGRVSESGPGSRALEVLAGPGAQLPNLLAGTLRNRPQFDWADSKDNYATLRLDPMTREARVVHHAADGSVLHDRTYVVS